MKSHIDLSNDVLDRWIRPAQCAELWGVAISTWNAWRSRGDPRVPPPVVSRPRYAVWRMRDVLAARERYAERCQAEPAPTRRKQPVPSGASPDAESMVNIPRAK